MNLQIAFEDSGFFGLLVTVLYFLAFILSMSVGLSEKTIFVKARAVQSFFWWSITAFMLFMSINKQLDLQTIFISLGKSIFISLDIYDVRRDYQRLFTFGLVFIFAFLLVFVFIKLLPTIKKHLPAILGLLFLIVYIAVRTVEINRLGYLLGSIDRSMHLERLFELAGVLLIVLNAIILLRQKKLREKNVVACQSYY